jgi:DNA-binding CsgD family transcriptional regulator
MSAGTGPAHLKEAIENLTDREFTILRMTCENVPTRVIAEAFGLSERTVQGHRHHIYQKLGLNSADKLIEAIPREWLKSRR